jgi:glycerophosphoryl diester phosphodiesterase
MSTPLLIAHRGITSVAIENSLAAFRAAVEKSGPNCDGVELDVHTTRDGKTVVHHDPTLPSGRSIAHLNLAEVQEERLADGSAPPSLDEAVAALGRLRIYVEAKGVTPEGDRDLLRIVADPVRRDRCQVHSFDHRVIARVVAQAPELTCGVLSASYPIEPVEMVRAAGARVLWQQCPMIDAELVGACDRAGIEVIAWTARTRQERHRLAELGVTGVCADL